MKKILGLMFVSLILLTGILYAKNPTYTTYLNLEKPDVDDDYDVGVWNANYDLIDAALGPQHETTGEHKTITPKVDNTSDVGSSSLAFRDVFIKRNFSDGTNTATMANIKDAVDKKHTQNTDQYLDQGGANQVAVADVKDAADKKHAQGTDQGLDTGGVNAVTAADVKDAATKKHSQNTDTKVGVASNGILKTSGGDGTLGVATPGTDYAPMASGRISGFIHHSKFTISGPSGVYSQSSIISVWTLTDAAITIDSIRVTTSSASYEVAGDLKYADARIGLANATLINDFDTSSGVRFDNSIATASVPSGKYVYLSFDSQPNSSMTDVTYDIAWHY